jgi:tripartite-type tricarboxylate transporter receptor subunit TctC
MRIETELRNVEQSEQEDHVAYKFVSAAAIGAILLACCGAPSSAQAPWPKAKSIRWLIGLPAGGGADPVTRAVTERLAQKLGTTIVIENKPGANQALAAAELARSEPDGYTVMTVAIPTLYNRPVPEIGSGLDPVAHLSRGALILAGTKKINTPDLESLIAAMKEKPDGWSYGTAGIASAHHIGGELINSLAGTRMRMVPYRGGGASINDAVAGHIPLIVIGIGPVIPHIESGLLRGYGVTSKERFQLLPDVPTMTEAGLPGIELSQSFGVSIRSGTPKAIVERLNKEINAALATDEVKAFILKQGAIAQSSTPEQWGNFYLMQKSKMTELARRLGIEVKD